MLFRLFTIGACIAVSAGVLGADTIKLKNGPRQSPAMTAAKSGIKHIENGDANAAEAAFRESLRLDPHTPEAYVGLADLAARRGETAEAEKYLQQALAVGPDNPAVQRSWGRYLMDAKRYRQAESAFNTALNAPGVDSALVHQDIGNLYLVQNRFEEAVRAFRKAVTIEPGKPDFHRALGTALTAIGRKSEAEAELMSAIRLDQGNPAHKFALGLFYSETRDYAKAVATFTELIAGRPGDAGLLVARGDVFSASGDCSKALADYEAAARLQRNSAEIHFKRGLGYACLQRHVEAQAAFLETVRLNRAHAHAYNNLAFLAAERKQNLEQALEWAGRAVALEPKNASFKDTLAWVRRARGERAVAIGILEKAVQSAPGRADLVYHLGILQAETGNAAAARASLQRAIDLGNFGAAADARRRLSELNR